MTSTIERLPSSATRVASATLHALLGSRRRQLLFGATLLALGLAFKWNWLAAIGVAPVILSLLPCAVMCAFGLCMMKMGSPAPGSPPLPAEAPSPNSLAVQGAALSAESRCGPAEACRGALNQRITPTPVAVRELHPDAGNQLGGG